MDLKHTTHTTTALIIESPIYDLPIEMNNIDLNTVTTMKNQDSNSGLERHKREEEEEKEREARESILMSMGDVAFKNNDLRPSHVLRPDKMHEERLLRKIDHNHIRPIVLYALWRRSYFDKGNIKIDTVSCLSDFTCFLNNTRLMRDHTYFGMIMEEEVIEAIRYYVTRLSLKLRGRMVKTDQKNNMEIVILVRGIIRKGIMAFMDTTYRYYAENILGYIPYTIKIGFPKNEKSSNSILLSRDMLYKQRIYRLEKQHQELQKKKECDENDVNPLLPPSMDNDITTRYSTQNRVHHYNKNNSFLQQEIIRRSFENSDIRIDFHPTLCALHHHWISGGSDPLADINISNSGSTNNNSNIKDKNSRKRKRKKCCNDTDSE